MKKITDNSAYYDAAAPTWARNRAVRAGEGAVKAGKEIYLPRTSPKQKDAEYDAYLARAYFYAATGRTVDAYTGLIFRKPPQVALPPAIEPFQADIDLQGTTLTGMAEKVVEDAVIVARGGILVDYPQADIQEATVAEIERANIRPYLAFYPAESIRDWRMGRVNGRTQLTFLKLFERVPAESGDFLQEAFIDQYRVLWLNDSWQYEIVIFREVTDAEGKEKKWIEWSRKTPIVQGKTEGEIPFVFVGSRSATPDIQEAPISDIAAVNLSHYRNSADYENGLHWVGSPTPVFIGDWTPDEEGNRPEFVILGSSSGICMVQGSDVKFLEFEGQGLEGGLGAAMARKEKHMALLGSRVLMDEKKAAEAAQTAEIHRAGEASVLASLANAISSAITRALGIMARWVGADEKAVVFTLNTDFAPSRLSAQDIQALMLAWQGGGISQQTLFEQLQAGEIIRAGKTLEDEQAEIDAETPDLPPPAKEPAA